MVAIKRLSGVAPEVDVCANSSVADWFLCDHMGLLEWYFMRFHNTHNILIFP